MRKVLVVLSLLLAGELAQLHASPINYAYVTDQSNYNASAGGTVTIQLYLQENLTGTGQTSLINAVSGTQTGLFSGSTNVSFTGVTGGTAAFITNIGVNGASLPNGFNGPGSSFTTVSSTSASLIENTNGLPNAAGVQTSAFTFSTGSGTGILLGSLTVTAGGAGSVTTFTIGPQSGDFGADQTFLVVGQPNNSLDSSNLSGLTIGGTTYTWNGATATTFTVTVDAVPEPGSLALLGGVVFAGGARWWTKRRKGKIAEAAAV